MTFLCVSVEQGLGQAGVGVTPDCHVCHHRLSSLLVGDVCLLFAHALGIDFYAVIIFSKRLTMSPNQEWGWS